MPYRTPRRPFPAPLPTVALALLGSIAAPRLAGAASLSLPSDYRLTFEDNFDGASLDPAKWQQRRPNELRVKGYNAADAVSVSGGLLAITTFTENRTFTDSTGTTVSGTKHFGGMIGTQQTFRQRYGYFEASINFASLGQGVQGAFWLQSQDNTSSAPDPRAAGTEIDTVEYFPGPGFAGTASHSVNWGGYNARGAINTSTLQTPDLGLDDGLFHTFGLLWTPDLHEFYVDGELTRRITDVGAGPVPVSDHDEYLILSSEVVGYSKTGSIPSGGYGSRDTSQAKMFVDYVRVYSNDLAAVPEPMTAAGLLAGLGLLVTRRRRGIE